MKLIVTNFYVEGYSLSFPKYKIRNPIQIENETLEDCIQPFYTHSKITAYKASVVGVFPDRIFLHLDWIRRFTE